MKFIFGGQYVVVFLPIQKLPLLATICPKWMGEADRRAMIEKVSCAIVRSGSKDTKPGRIFKCCIDEKGDVNEARDALNGY